MSKEIATTKQQSANNRPPYKEWLHNRPRPPSSKELSLEVVGHNNLPAARHPLTTTTKLSSKDAESQSANDKAAYKKWRRSKAWLTSSKELSLEAVDDNNLPAARHLFTTTKYGPFILASALLKNRTDLFIALTESPPPACPLSRSNAGATFLHTAARLRNPEALRHLLSIGLSPEHTAGYHNQTPLIFAAKANSPECVRLLIDAGADIDRRDEVNHTALDYYLRHDDHDPEIAQLLGHQAPPQPDLSAGWVATLNPDLVTHTVTQEETGLTVRTIFNFEVGSLITTVHDGAQTTITTAPLDTAAPDAISCARLSLQHRRKQEPRPDTPPPRLT